MFCETAPALQKAWDNTSISLLKECPYKYYLSIIEGYQPKKKAAPLVYGGLYHACLEQYDKHKARGDDDKVALRKAVRYGLEKCGTRDEAGTFIPWEPYEPKETARNRFTLIRSIVWYAEAYKDDSITTYVTPDGKPAVELSFRIELPLTSPDGDNYLYCGHLDKVGIFNNQGYVIERKHTKYGLDEKYFAKFSPDGQVTGYTVSSKTIVPIKIVGTIIDAAQVGVGFTRFQRSPSMRTNAQCDEWLENTMEWIKFAENCAEKESWPMNETSCHKYSGCIFQDCCNKDPGVREAFLKSNFKIDHWNPLENRGD
jgi:hypothetical protein